MLHESINGIRNLASVRIMTDNHMLVLHYGVHCINVFGGEGLDWVSSHPFSHQNYFAPAPSRHKPI